MIFSSLSGLVELTCIFRHLLTHSAGLSYDYVHPLLQRFRKLQNHSTSWTRPGLSRDNFLFPVLSEPGTEFTYGVGVDWAGIMVEVVNGGMKLQEYFQKNIWEPLGIKEMTFHLERNEALRGRLADLSVRINVKPEGLGSKVAYTEHIIPDPVEDNLSHGLISTAGEYQKILSSMCANDGRLLKPETVDEMFKPHLSPEAQVSLVEQLNTGLFPQVSATGRDVDWGLGGALHLKDAWTGRRANSMSWSGMPNCFWWIDRQAGLSGLYFSTLLPSGDKKSIDTFTAFEKTMYDGLRN
jgi:CubicO group peptidase (beta-lactamase class C family)